MDLFSPRAAPPLQWVSFTNRRAIQHVHNHSQQQQQQQQQRQQQQQLVGAYWLGSVLKDMIDQ